MDKKIAGLLGAAAALTTVTAAHAATPAQATELAAPTSYQDLLLPVANAVAALKSDDARLAETPAGTQTAQYHHPHHPRHRRRPHHHHHHPPHEFLGGQPA